MAKPILDKESLLQKDGKVVWLVNDQYCIPALLTINGENSASFDLLEIPVVQEPIEITVMVYDDRPWPRFEREV